MEQRIQKEFRSLLAPWLLAFLLATTALWGRPGADENAAWILWLACFSPGMVLLAVAAFGKEFSQGTILALLGQPISRSRLWLEKAGALALAMLAVLLAFNVIVYYSLGADHPVSSYLAHHPVARVGLLVSVVAWSGGLCSALLLRQAIAAFWMALLLPISLGLTLEYLGGKFFPTQSPGTWWIVAMIVYSGVAGVGSWWLFLHYQDTQRMRDRTLYPFRFRLAWFGGKPQRSARAGNGTRAMMGKELHLQQINIICSLVLLLLFAPAFVPGTLWESNERKRIAEILGMIIWLVLAVIPLLAGAVAISEERRLGLLEWQFSLPASRFRQFLTKLCATYLLSMFLGALLPWFLNGLVWSYATHKDVLLGDVGFEGSALLFLAAFAGLTTTLGLYASSLSRNLVESLTLAGILLVAIAVATALIQFELIRYSPSPLLLGGWLAVPTLFVLLLFLSFRNCAKPVTGFRSFLSDAPILGITIVVLCATTLGLWARVWELALPAPTRPDGPSISGMTSPEIVLRGNRLLVLLPDGRIWGRGTWWNTTQTEPPPGVGDSSRWMALASTSGTDMAIKEDGTLWAWGAWPLEGGKTVRYQGAPIQVGDESDWKSMACGYSHAVALKRDGSLWTWGSNKYGQLGDGTKTNRASPVRIGHDSDWTAVAGGGEYSLAVKKDGTLWHWGLFTSLLGYNIERASLMWSSPARIGTGTNWTSVFCAEYFAMASQNDGSLWAWRQVLDAQTGTYDLAREPVRVGGALSWKTVAPSFGGTTGISSDGTLLMWAAGDTWRPWRFRRSPRGRDDLIKLSERSSWIAVAVAGETVLALSADGSLWEWGRSLDEPPGKRRFLSHSRWPRLIADLGTAKGRE